MHTDDSRLGWILALAGLLLLIVMGKVSLLLILVPAALLLACGMLRLTQKLAR